MCYLDINVVLRDKRFKHGMCISLQHIQKESLDYLE